MTSKEVMKWIKDNYIYLIEEYYNQPLDTKQCIIDMANPKFFIIEEDLDKLEKLEIKEKPMKPIIYNLNQYKCPKCLNQIKGQKMLYNMKTKRRDIKCKIITEKVYCPYCGQKLNWKE